MPHSELVVARFNFVDEAFRAARAASPSLNYVHLKDDAQAFRLQLHLTIIELTGACLALFNTRIYSPLPILIRVMYEAVADQARLARDSGYSEQMLKTAMDEGRNLPKLMNQHGFGMLKAFLRGHGAREFLALLKRESNSRKQWSQDSVEDRFIAAGMENEYIMHRLLSGHVHNDAAALQGRHASKQTDETVRYDLFKTPDDAVLCAHLSTAAGLLLRSCAATHPGAEPFRTLAVQLDGLIRSDRARWPELHNLGRYASTARTVVRPFGHCMDSVASERDHSARAAAHERRIDGDCYGLSCRSANESLQSTLNWTQADVHSALGTILA